jgi:hypothetical protein
MIRYASHVECSLVFHIAPCSFFFRVFTTDPIYVPPTWRVVGVSYRAQLLRSALEVAIHIAQRLLSLVAIVQTGAVVLMG